MRRTRLFQWLHAAAILVLPTAAAVVAVWELATSRGRPWFVALAVLLYGLTMTGVTVGFHRLLAHRAFATHDWLRAALAILGSMAMQGPPIYWTSNHRRHHQFSDEPRDPHSPRRHEDRELRGWAGFWHAHVGWTFTHELSSSTVYCKDLLRDGVVMWVNRRYYAWVVLGAAIPALLGALVERSASGALEGLLWGAGVRLFLSYHLTSSINSITHLFGYRRFATNDDSRNSLWLGAVTLGEAWHNNHHAHPSSAIFGIAWWELDVGGAVVRGLERLGLAWAVRRPAERLLATKRLPLDGAR